MADASTPAAPAAKKKRPSICHSCQRTVVWVLLEGKRCPLDFLEAGGGDVALEPELFAEKDAITRARYVGVGTHYRRHLESCPDADKWRGRWKRTAERPFSKFQGKKTR